LPTLAPEEALSRLLIFQPIISPPDVISSTAANGQRPLGDVTAAAYSLPVLFFSPKDNLEKMFSCNFILCCANDKNKSEMVLVVHSTF
jgi:hypothetical protein